MEHFSELVSVVKLSYGKFIIQNFVIIFFFYSACDLLHDFFLNKLFAFFMSI